MADAGGDPLPGLIAGYQNGTDPDGAKFFEYLDGQVRRYLMINYHGPEGLIDDFVSEVMLRFMKAGRAFVDRIDLNVNPRVYVWNQIGFKFLHALAAEKATWRPDPLTTILPLSAAYWERSTDRPEWPVIEADEKAHLHATVLASVKTFRFPKHRRLYAAMVRTWVKDRGFYESMPYIARRIRVLSGAMRYWLRRHARRR